MKCLNKVDTVDCVTLCTSKHVPGKKWLDLKEID